MASYDPNIGETFDAVSPTDLYNNLGQVYNALGTQGALPLSSNNYAMYGFDTDSGNGQLKGAGLLAETNDGQAIFAFYDSNFNSINSSFVDFYFTWICYNGVSFLNQPNGFPTIPGGCYETQIIRANGDFFNGPSSYQVPYGGGAAWSNFASPDLNTPWNVVNQGVGPYITPAGGPAGNFLTPYNATFTTFNVNGYNCFACRYAPDTSQGSIQFYIINIGHFQSGGGVNQSWYNDFGQGANQIFTFTPPPPPPLPTLLPPSSYNTGALFSGWSNVVQVDIGPTAVVNTGSPPPPPPPPPAIKLISISVVPTTDTLVEGQGAIFQCFGLWTDGVSTQLFSSDYASQNTRTPSNQFNPPYITWSVVNVNGSGNVDSGGNFTAYTFGSDCQVWAEIGNLSAKADVTIIQVPIPQSVLLSLAITPIDPVVQIEQSVQFTAVGQSQVYSDYRGTISSSVQTTYPPVLWTTVPGIGAGTIDQNGNFTATDIRKQLSTNWWQGSSGSYLPASLNGPLPNAATTTTIDGPIDYGFTQTLPSGIGPSYFYMRSIGYVNPPFTGNYIFGINSQDGANLYVNGQAMFLDLQNNHVAEPAGYPTKTSAPISLTANGRYPIVIEWGHGAGSSSALELLWEPPGQAMQLIPGANLEGDEAGGAPCTVIATAQDGSGIQATTNPDIVAGPPPPPPPSYMAQLVISPLTAVVPAGSTQLFTATALDEFGAVVPGVQVNWSVVNTNGAGTITPITVSQSITVPNQQATFYGEIAGTNITVTATTVDGAFSASAHPIVVAGPAFRIGVTPPSDILQIGFGQQFVATAYDSFGNAFIPSGIVWSVIGGIGSTNQTGLFLATYAGPGRIVATLGELSGWASINVLVTVGGVIIKNTQQQPFANIHVRDVVANPTVIDTRVRGGGLISPRSIDTSDAFWWDIGAWDGNPFQQYGVYAGMVTLTPGPGQTVDGDLSQTLIQQVFSKYGAPQFYGAISPLSSVPQ